MTKTATDMLDDLAELAEKIKETAETQIRKDLADELIAFTKGRSQGSEASTLRDYATGEDGSTPYVPGLPEDWKPTKDFMDGLRFAASLLRDKDYEF